MSGKVQISFADTGSGSLGRWCRLRGMSGLQVQLSADPKQTSQVVLAGLRAFNRQHLGEFESEPIAVELVGDGGEILGGATGTLMLGWLFVDMLWLPEEVRRSGMGTQVMDLLESQAIERGATRATQ